MAWIEAVNRLFRNADRPKDDGKRTSVIPAADNPYGVDLWDCAAFTKSMVSTSADPAMAAQFMRLRASTGIEFRTQLPANATSIDCALSYTVGPEFSDGALFKATAMEDKWDLYLFHPYIYFARSWSGQLVYRATVQFEDQRMVITQIESGKDQDAEFSRRAVDYLIKSHVLGAIVPHPLPSTLPTEPTQIAVFSFSTFGRRCARGTYADTTVLPTTFETGLPTHESAV
jgi:hypothetical protein